MKFAWEGFSFATFSKLDHLISNFDYICGESGDLTWLIIPFNLTWNFASGIYYKNKIAFVDNNNCIVILRMHAIEVQGIYRAGGYLLGATFSIREVL